MPTDIVLRGEAGFIGQPLRGSFRSMAIVDVTQPD
jgi:hypothetical protein